MRLTAPTPLHPAYAGAAYTSEAKCSAPLGKAGISRRHGAEDH